MLIMDKDVQYPISNQTQTPSYGNYYDPTTTAATSFSKVSSIATSLQLTKITIGQTNYALICNVANDSSSQLFLNCIIPSGRKFIISIDTKATDSGNVTFTAMKFGR